LPIPWDMAFQVWFDRVRFRCAHEKAQTMAEYAVVLAVITPAIVIAYGVFSGKIGALLNSVASLL
jgi:Flp pilus assembly pilin Flp